MKGRRPLVLCKARCGSLPSAAPPRSSIPMRFLRPCSALVMSAAFLAACASKQDGAAGAPFVGGGGERVALDDSAGVSGSAGSRNGAAGREEPPPSAGTSSSAAGTSSSIAGAAGSSPTAGGPSVDSCGSGGNSAGFEQDCLACAQNSCDRCLCSDCTEQLQHCAATPGCAEILVCTRQSGCSGSDCYCGDFGAVACVQGQANGPCKSVILDAPGGHVPTLVNPSGGPASDAAVAISTCTQAGHPCASDCTLK
jgi:hypothetical protein